MNGLFDYVYAVHHLCVRDHQGRSKPEYNDLDVNRPPTIHKPNNIPMSGLS